MEEEARRPVLIFSKTCWHETPRIRHQLARMFLKRGHEVVFFEKPRYGILKKPSIRSVVDGPTGKRIILVTTLQLMHHQLRVLEIFNPPHAPQFKDEH